MQKKNYEWEVVSKSRTGRKSRKGRNRQPTKEDIIRILLENRGLKSNKEIEEFFNPTSPNEITLKELGINEKEVSKTLSRIGKAIGNNEKIIIYGDYDADGICATAILWETLYELTKNVTPYLPDRFSEGYGINAESIQKIKNDNPDLGLIITVDNGIVASNAIKIANELGIDVIVTDHHQTGKILPEAYSIIHTDKISGAGISWFLAREIGKNKQISKAWPTSLVNKYSNKQIKNNSPSTVHRSLFTALELAAIGTIADQLPLIGINRSIAKYGLKNLKKTERPGLLALFKEAAIEAADLGTYHVNYLIAPRLNAMGRMEHAIDSLRLLCTKSSSKASELAGYLERPIGNVRKWLGRWFCTHLTMLRRRIYQQLCWLMNPTTKASSDLQQGN
jgi:single-stranded-DNA-specific exonuclease